MAATRLMPTEEGQDLIDLTREICEKELRPKVDEAERAAADGESFPTDAFRTLGRAGLLSLPHPEEFGGVQPALRGLPPGRRGDRLGVDERRGRRLACTR